uniref:tetratricopeptide repeat protein n=1 Tax=Chamaesiphon sp. VAR_69_metabat_338 TaxID=2964704 RepID=UPI00286DE9DB
ALYASGDYRKALADYDRGIARDPNNAEFHFNRGVTHAQLNMNQKAIADYNTAIRLQPNYALAYSNRGLLHAQMRSNPAATEDLKMAAKLFQSQNNTVAYESVLRKLATIK